MRYVVHSSEWEDRRGKCRNLVDTHVTSIALIHSNAPLSICLAFVYGVQYHGIPIVLSMVRRLFLNEQKRFAGCKYAL
jgi:hypothetical protein